MPYTQTLENGAKISKASDGAFKNERRYGCKSDKSMLVSEYENMELEQLRVFNFSYLTHSWKEKTPHCKSV